jgi:dipeptidyl aminopeptidase/acylaminoacyl peptidase
MSGLKLYALAGMAAVQVGTAGCGAEDGIGPGSPVATVVITPPSATIEVSQSVTFTAQGNAVAGKAIAWTSSNETVATVGAGVVTGIAVGQATISASSDGKVGTASVTVVGSAPPTAPIYFEDRGEGGIYRINPDGSGLTLVTSGGAPALAPTGNRVAFLCGFNLCTAHTDGTNRAQITSDGPYSRPDWSPTSTQLVSSWGGGEIWMMNQDGTGRIKLTSGFSDDAPSWSPNGDLILFARSIEGVGPVLYTMHPDGSGVTQTSATRAIWGAWSPDGRQIAYTVSSFTGMDVVVINADGSGMVHLTNNPPFNDLAPSWSPDGKWIAFSSNRAGTMDIYIMRSDGSDVQRLTSGGDYEGFPAWAP